MITIVITSIATTASIIAAYFIGFNAKKKTPDESVYNIMVGVFVNTYMDIIDDEYGITIDRKHIHERFSDTMENRR